MFMSKLSTRNENKIDFKKKTCAELQELLERQNKIFNNRRFIDELPDKGEKVTNLRTQLEVELKKRDVHRQLCENMSSLNIGIDQLDALEWTGKQSSSVKLNNIQPVVDDDDRDALKIFVSHSGINQDKIIIREKPEEPLIKPSDLIEEEPIVENVQTYKIEELPENVERYAKNLCGRFDISSPLKNEHLLLNKPIKPNKHSIVKASTVSLKESIILQFSHKNKLKELKDEKLKNRPIPKYDFGKYREPVIEDIDSDTGEDETLEDNILEDDLDENNGTIVVVNSSY